MHPSMSASERKHRLYQGDTPRLSQDAQHRGQSQLYRDQQATSVRADVPASRALRDALCADQ